MEKERLWFSTSVDLRIDGVIYRPSICYPLPALAKRALDKYVAEGKVKFYTKQMRFVNGVAVEMENVSQKVMPKPVLATDKNLPQNKNKKKGEGWNPKF